MRLLQTHLFFSLESEHRNSDIEDLGNRYFFITHSYSESVKISLILPVNRYSLANQ